MTVSRCFRLIALALVPSLGATIATAEPPHATKPKACHAGTVPAVFGKKRTCVRVPGRHPGADLSFATSGLPARPKLHATPKIAKLVTQVHKAAVAPVRASKITKTTQAAGAGATRSTVTQPPPSAPTTTTSTAPHGVVVTTTTTTDPTEFGVTVGEGKDVTSTASETVEPASASETNGRSEHNRTEVCPDADGVIHATLEQTYTTKWHVDDGHGVGQDGTSTVTFDANITAHVDDNAKLTTFDLQGAATARSSNTARLAGGSTQTSTDGPVAAYFTLSGVDGHNPDALGANTAGAFHVTGPKGTDASGLSKFFEAVGTYRISSVRDASRLLTIAEEVWQGGKCTKITAPLPSHIDAGQKQFSVDATVAALHQAGKPPVVKWTQECPGNGTISPPTASLPGDAHDKFTVTDSGQWRHEHSACAHLSATSRMGIAHAGGDIPLEIAYTVTFAGSGSYALNRTNVYGGASFQRSQSDTFGWSTTWTTDLDATITSPTSIDGRDSLSGGPAENHEVDTGTFNDQNRTCRSTGPLTETGSNPPQITLSPAPAGSVPPDYAGKAQTGVKVHVEAFNVPQWDADCGDGPGPQLAPVDLDNDTILDEYPFGATFTTESEKLRTSHANEPYVIQVSSVPGDANRDCAVPSENLVSCTSRLTWHGTVTIVPADPA